MGADAGAQSGVAPNAGMSGAAIDRAALMRQLRVTAADLIADWSLAEIVALRAEVPLQALKTPFRRGTVKDVALAMLAIADQGLRWRNRGDGLGRDETRYLNPLFRIAESALSPAEELLAAFERRWDGRVDPVFREYAY